MINSKEIDTRISIIQRLVIIAGLFISAWFFIYREESSPHVRLSLKPELMPECVIRVNTEIENMGGRVWNLESAIARVFLPILDRIRDPEVNKEIEIGTQIIKTNQILKIGETSSIGFNIKLNGDVKSSFYIVKVAITVKEEDNQWIRVAETSLKADGC